jgi:hypothetical protein
MYPLQCPKAPGDAIVGIMTMEHLIEVAYLLPGSARAASAASDLACA